MFRRFVNGPWAAVLSLCLGILSIPSMMEDAVAWSGWFARTPPVVSLGLLSVGSLLLMRYVFASRERIRHFGSKLLGATSAGHAAFRTHFRPPICTAVWSDLNSDQAPLEVNRWEILEHTIRKTGLVDGEAYPALVGMAQVKEIQGQRCVYMCKFLHADSSHMELRIQAHDDPVLRRRAVLRIDGEVLSETTFQPCLTPAVLDSRNRKGIREETAHLLESGDVLSLSITDTIPDHSGGRREHRHDLLRVPLRGYNDVEARLSRVAPSLWSASLLSYSPPEFVPALDPPLIDHAMRLITDPVSFAEWRKNMAARFVADDLETTTIDRTE